MAIRTVGLGGSDFSDNAVLPAADMNDTIGAVDGVLGEVKMFALSMTGAETKANLQTRGWAICDGTTPATQGISSPTITTTPDLQDKFLRMSNDETSGGTGGVDNNDHTHNVNVYGVWNVDTGGQGTDQGAGTYLNAVSNPNVAAAMRVVSQTLDNKPPYYEVVYFMKVKLI